MTKLTLLRYSDNGDSTQGLLFLNGEFECYILEDEYRDDKIRGETRIDQGYYPLVFQTQETPLTIKYRKRHSWFNYHIMIDGLPRHSSVYFHTGNKDEHTMGCPLTGDMVNNNKYSEEGEVMLSTKAYSRLYQKIAKDVGNGMAWIEIIDFDRIYKEIFHKRFDKLILLLDVLSVFNDEQPEPAKKFRNKIQGKGVKAFFQNMDNPQ